MARETATQNWKLETLKKNQSPLPLFPEEAQSSEGDIPDITDGFQSPY